MEKSYRELEKLDVKILENVYMEKQISYPHKRPYELEVFPKVHIT